MSHHGELRRCTVYGGHGERALENVEVPETPDGRLGSHPMSADAVAVRHIMSNELICARDDLAISAVIDLMIRHRVGCLPVVDNRRRAIGLITKFDLVEQLDAGMRVTRLGASMPNALVAQTAGDVMMPLAMSVPENVSVARAAALMNVEGTHHVLVTSANGCLVGVVSSLDIVRWFVEHDSAVAADADALRRSTWASVDD